MQTIWWGVGIPFLGTAVGAACVFFVQRELDRRWQQSLNGFAAGIMVAASVWSLLLPAMEQTASMGRLAFVPATVGFAVGMAGLYVTDGAAEKLCAQGRSAFAADELRQTAMLLLAVTLHNIPEGMAVGVALAGFLRKEPGLTAPMAMALAAGIGIQNIPEGAIISLPLKSQGSGGAKAFWYGVLSGAVEPIAALLTVLAAGWVVPLLPYLLGFAAGAMFYVVIAELLPQTVRSALGIPAFTVGFALMLALDNAVG